MCDVGCEQWGGGSFASPVAQQQRAATRIVAACRVRFKTDDENRERKHQAHEEPGGCAFQRQPAQRAPFPAQEVVAFYSIGLRHGVFPQVGPIERN